MATSISTNTQVSFVNSVTRAGTVLLPSSFTTPGRMLTFKDQTGAFSTNFLTVTTNNANQSINTISPSTIVTGALGWTTVVAGNNNQWYTVGGSVLNMINTSTVTTTVLNSSQISTGNVFVSSLRFQDQTFTTSTNQLYATSTFLYYQTSNQSTIIAGSRQSFGALFMTPAVGTFQPNQVGGLNLWIDAADTGTFAMTTGNQLTAIYDKSGANSRIDTFDGSSVIYEPNGFYGLPSFNMSNGHFRGTISSSRPMTNFTNTTFIVTQLTSVPGNGFTCMALASSNTGSSFFYRCLDYSTAAGQAYRMVAFNNTFVSVTYVDGQIVVPLLFNTNYNGSVSGNTLLMRLNGSATGVVTQTMNSTWAQTAGFFFVGSDGSTTDYTTNMWTGRISEILMYNVQLNATQQQQVEGYLAWKWGIVANLPASHPYKNFPP